MGENDFVQIPVNVMEFINKVSNEVGRVYAENWNQDTWCFIHDYSIESPIEQILYTALKAVQSMNSIENAEPEKINGELKLIGLYIQPQKQIGKYRVDFLISYDMINSRKEVIIECDSQEWHERTEKERRYEKSRDRCLLLNEYKIFHYTGKEIVENPLSIAVEILSYLTGLDKDMLITSINC